VTRRLTSVERRYSIGVEPPFRNPEIVPTPVYFPHPHAPQRVTLGDDPQAAINAPAAPEQTVAEQIEALTARYR